MRNARTLLFAGLAAAAMFAGQAFATPVSEFNEPPPPGWVLNLNGMPIPKNPVRYVQYTADFTATQTITHITFALTDSTFDAIFLDNIVVANLANSNVNLIQNGGFEGGTASSGGNASAPVDWQYLDPYGTWEDSTVGCGGYGQSGSSCAWIGGFEQAYDLITQPVATAIGGEYQISFWAQGPDEGDYWQGLNTVPGWPPQPEGNSFNIAVYAGSIPTPAVPEPAALGMFGLGLLLIGGFSTLRRREQGQA